MGVSTIVGSAVFNVLCVTAICGIFAGKVSGFMSTGKWKYLLKAFGKHFYLMRKMLSD